MPTYPNITYYNPTDGNGIINTPNVTESSRRRDARSGGVRGAMEGHFWRGREELRVSWWGSLLCSYPLRNASFLSFHCATFEIQARNQVRIENPLPNLSVPSTSSRYPEHVVVDLLCCVTSRGASRRIRRKVNSRRAHAGGHYQHCGRAKKLQSHAGSVQEPQPRLARACQDAQGKPGAASQRNCADSYSCRLLKVHAYKSAMTLRFRSTL